MNHFNYEKGIGKEKNWFINEQKFDGRYLGKCEAIFCQGNGYLGVRNALEESYTGTVRDMFVTGTFDKCCEKEATELPNIPDITEMEIRINGRPFSLEQGRIHHYERVMNLRNGEVVREVDWEDREQNRIHITFRRFVSMEEEHVIGARIEIEPISADVEITIRSGINGRVSNSGSQHFSEGDRRLYDSKYLEMVSETVQSQITVGVYTSHRFYVNEKEKEFDVLPLMSTRKVEISAGRKLCKGERLSIEKLSAVFSTRDMTYADLEKEKEVETMTKDGQKKIRKLHEAGYHLLKQKSEEAWKKIWDKEDISVTSANSFDQLALRFAVYHLNIMVKRDDNRVGISAKALTGEGYKGHSFWDTEIFLLPYYLLTDPNTAKTLLEYRYRNLYGARKKAEEYGYEGAMYPWEAAWIDDGEVTPVWGPADVVTGKPMQYLTGLIEQHISADVAYAVHQYEIATEDEYFMEHCGYEMILDTAKFWVSRLEWKEDRQRYEITDIIGPDEYKEHVNNNAYTNYMAYFNMQLAVQILDKLKSEKQEQYDLLDKKLDLNMLEQNLISRIKLLYLPEAQEKEGIIPQFEGYLDLKYLDLSVYKASSEVLTIYNEFSPEQINEYQVSKQGDLVVLFYLLKHLFDDETKLKNYKYYEERTLHDSSLSKCTHGVVACDLGLCQEAYQFYTGACKVDLGEEMKSSDAGIHSAAMGGIWQMAVFGFGGIRIDGEQLHIHPNLPKEWENLKFRIIWKRSPLTITVTKEQVEIKNSGKAVTLLLMGEETCIKEGETVTEFL